MRILSHNSLKCPAKDVTVGYPLQIEVDELEVVETECNPEFIKSQLPSLDWKAIIVAADAIGLKGIPAEYNSSLLEDNDFILAMHNLLLDIHIIKGYLLCPESGRRFPIENRIVNMMYVKISKLICIFVSIVSNLLFLLQVTRDGGLILSALATQLRYIGTYLARFHLLLVVSVYMLTIYIVCMNCNMLNISYNHIFYIFYLNFHCL